MNKSEFIDVLSHEVKLSKIVLREVLDKQFKIIKRELLTGGEINFKNLGKIYVVTKRERFCKINKKTYLISQKSEPKIKLFNTFKNIVK